ncbi:hypothetical protein QEH56_04900 [Pelagicoccus enzymogenes]|uniref:hypothetical protein n=1 Tax=Pelagicoccus enzymogenes TaxID=2773457 RepID=UPI00280CB405|nr:hypothetical protein [Pelagicoccus enzymogenes]MDQ8197473.1 hypothetical protein [Pelagicoccus enzymogenes]
MEIGDVQDGELIVAEKRDSTLDLGLEPAWIKVKVQGTRPIQASQIEKRIRSLNLRDKKDKIAGLQLADLVLTPVERHILEKKTNEDFRIIESKLHRSPSGRIDSYG